MSTHGTVQLHHQFHNLAIIIVYYVISIISYMVNSGYYGCKIYCCVHIYKCRSLAESTIYCFVLACVSVHVHVCVHLQKYKP